MVAEPDERDLLMIIRALNVQKRANNEQKENIFHNRCTIQGKVYSLIIVKDLAKPRYPKPKT